MRTIKRWILLLLALCQLLTILPAWAENEPIVASAQLRSTTTVQNGMVRVLLSSMGYPSKLDVTLSGAFVADGSQDIELPAGAKISVSMNASTGEISLQYGTQTYYMGQTLALRRRATDGQNGFKLAQAKKSANLYPGDLHLTARLIDNKWRLYPVAHVYLEYYLHGVLPYEMGNSAELEALKAQAVAARTFTLRRMSGNSALYDLTDTTSDQVYYGNSSNTSRCTQAVNETKGISLMVDGRYAATYYTASNGGQTESVANAWGSKGYTESIVKDDPFDLQSSASTVKSAFIYKNNQHSAQPSQLKTLLNQKATAALGRSATVQTIHSATLHTPRYAAPSRLYRKMDLHVTAKSNGSTYQLTLTLDVFDELEPILGISINSGANELWSVTEENSAFRVSARRHGHGIGMSQRGAMQMAALGYTYDQILGFYYNGSYRMQAVFSHTILASVGNTTVTTTEQPADITQNTAVTATVTLQDPSSTVNVRAAANSNAMIRGTLPHGAQVNIISNDGTWCEIRTAKLEGFIKAEFLVYNTTTEPEATPTPTLPDATGYAYVNAPSGSLNFRNDKSTDSFIIAQIPTGTRIAVIASTDGWTNIIYNNQVGWVMTQYLSMIEEDAPGDENVPYARVNTTGGSLNLRAAADSNANVLAQIPQGASIPVFEKQASWTRTAYAGQNGWVMNAYLIFDSDPDDTPTQAPLQAVVTGGSLNLRASQSSSSRVLARIPDGTLINIFAKNSEWSQTSYLGQTGWVMNRYLQFSTAPTTPPSTGPTPTPTPVPPAETPATILAVVTGGSLNLRSSASSSARVLTQIPNGTLVQVYENNGTWSRTDFAGYSGWVMSRYLAFQTISTPTPTPPVVTTPPTNVVPDHLTAMVIGGSLNMRSAANSNASVLLRIPNNARVVVVQRGITWSQVQYSGHTGYVMTQYLSFGDTSTVQTALVATDSGSLNLREEPKSNGRVLLQIPQYAMVEILQKQNEWCLVSYQGNVGYVMSRYLSFNTNSGSPVPDVPQASTPAPAPEATTPPPLNGDTAWVNVTGTLNMRRSADKTSVVLATLASGAPVEVIDHGADWSKVKVATLTGYVQTQFLSNTAPENLPVYETRYVVTETGSLNLRNNASSAATVILTIPQHQQVQLMSVSGSWSRVIYKGVTGYVQSQFLGVQPGSLQADIAQ